MHLSAEAACMYLSWRSTRVHGHAQADSRLVGRVAEQSAGAQRPASRVATRGMMARRGALRGRTAIAIGLAAFLVVTSSVVWRRARGNTAAARLHELGARVDELQAQRARLEGEVRRVSSRVELVPRVQRLGMHFPSDSQVIHLPDPVRR